MTEDLLSADAIDASFVPTARRDLSFVELEGETVMNVPMGEDEVTIRDYGFDTHWLDRTATIVWNCFDGSGSIDELADDLSEAFGADREVVLADVLELARTLGRAGLLEGVAPHRPDPPVSAPTTGVPIGTHVSFDGLSDVDGNEFGTGVRTGPVLVVNWNPGCGYCVQLGPQLAALVPELERSGVDLFLVATSTIEENRPVLELSGLDEKLLLIGKFELFDGLGTPTAYLVSEANETASDLVVGAGQVARLAEQAAGNADDE